MASYRTALALSPGYAGAHAKIGEALLLKVNIRRRFNRIEIRARLIARHGFLVALV